MQLDKPTFTNFRKRDNVGTGADSAASMFGWHPTLGMNGVYVGGAYQFGAFRGQGPGDGSAGTEFGNPTPAGNPRVSGGQFYVQRFADVKNPAKLIYFASSRGGDVGESGWFSWGAGKPDSGTIRPGYFLVLPPAPHPVGRQHLPYRMPWTLSGAEWGGPSGWNASNKFDARRVPSTWGMLDMRYGERGVTARIDGSVAMEGLETLRDMTKWSNVADRPDWTFPTNINQINW
jgi:hypothetical protein